MLQTHNVLAHDYEMPPALVDALVHGSTWDLFCRSCDRHAYPDVVALLERYGDDFDTDLLWYRSRCRCCGERLKMAGGAFVWRLQQQGELHRLVVADGRDFRPVGNAPQF